MLKIHPFVCNMIQENCYVVSDETREAVIIDCGAFYESEKKAIQEYIEQNELRPVHLLATHGHIDHNFGNKFVHDTWGLKVEVHASDEKLMNSLPMQAKAICGIEMQPSDFSPVGKYLCEEDVVKFGNHQFTLLETPGHSPGSVFFYCKEENVAFSGDTLFRNSIGRTDLPGGSMFLIIQSLRMVSQLPDNTKLYPGHGEPTTIGNEVANNPYIDR
ncbi:metallo-beta-lactamase domain protein [Bacteroidales bacterium KA00344]|nr:metallo-beta-lactamase domain protein [Bacteroidales bacterium KA00344]